MTATVVTAPAGTRLTDPDTLGTTTVTSRTVRRLAARAAAEVDGVLGSVKADATVDADSASLRVRLPLAYPTPIRRCAEQVRAHLLRRVTELSGLRVSRIDIDISLPGDDRPSRRVQ